MRARRALANVYSRPDFVPMVLLDAGDDHGLFSRTDLEGLARRVPDVIYRLRVWPSLAVEYVSAAAERYTGYAPEEFQANPGLFLEIIHPDDRQLLEERTRLGPNPAVVLFRWRRKDGRIVWAEHREAAIRDRRGDLVAIEGVARHVRDPTRGTEPTIRIVDGLRIDLAGQAVHVDGRPVHLTPAELKLLLCLTERLGSVVSRAELTRCLWRSEFTGGGHACESYISTLRHKIERDPGFPERIVTVRGRGYKYVGTEGAG